MRKNESVSEMLAAIKPPDAAISLKGFYSILLPLKLQHMQHSFCLHFPPISSHDSVQYASLLLQNINMSDNDIGL